MRTVDPVRHAARRAAIQEAAAGVFAEKGYTGATTAEICRAAGIGSGTLFHYFGDKRSIMISIFADDHAVNDELIATLDEDQRASPRSGGCSTTCAATSPTRSRPGWSVAMLQLAVERRGVRRNARGGRRKGAGPRSARLIARGRRRTAPSTRRWTRRERRAGWSDLVDTLYLMCGDEGFDAAAEVAELRRIAARYLGIAAPP